VRRAIEARQWLQGFVRWKGGLLIAGKRCENCVLRFLSSPRRTGLQVCAVPAPRHVNAMHIIELTKPDGRHLTLYSLRAIAPDPIAARPFPEPPRASPQQVAVHLEDA
jgi:hypothetical protein